MKKTFILTIVALMSLTVFAQETRNDSLTIDFKKYEISEQDVPMFGKQKLITGTIIIKQGEKEIGMHNFLVPVMKEPISHIAVYDSKGKRMEPRIHYDATKNCFTCNEGSDKEETIKITEKLNQKDLILFGLKIWVRLIYQTK
jgi:hypothetical protein